jgi:HlyD family secretion protein
VQDRKNVLKLPISALFRSGESWAVFVNEDSTARLREISLGQRNTLEAEVTEGLSENDLIILHPSDAVVDGVSVMQR